MTALDINSPRGRIAAADQLRAVEIVFGGANGFNFFSTATDDAAAIDGFIVRNSVITGLAEVKSRDMDYETLLGKYHGEWLLTFQKLLDIQKVSQLLHIPGYGLLFLIPSDMVLVLTLTNSLGTIVCRHREELTATKKTCNGGSIQRNNAYIDVSGAKIYRGNKP
jgi:hypothetical protein